MSLDTMECFLGSALYIQVHIKTQSKILLMNSEYQSLKWVVISKLTLLKVGKSVYYSLAMRNPLAMQAYICCARVHVGDAWMYTHTCVLGDPVS